MCLALCLVCVDYNSGFKFNSLIDSTNPFYKEYSQSKQASKYIRNHRKIEKKYYCARIHQTQNNNTRPVRLLLLYMLILHCCIHPTITTHYCTCCECHNACVYYFILQALYDFILTALYHFILAALYHATLPVL